MAVPLSDDEKIDNKCFNMLNRVLKQHVTLLSDGFHVPDVDAPSWSGVLESLYSTDVTEDQVERACRELECIDITRLHPTLFLGDISAHASRHAVALLGLTAIILVAPSSYLPRPWPEEAGFEYLVISQKRDELLDEPFATQLEACRKLFERRTPLLVCSEDGRGVAAAICAALLAEPYTPSDSHAKAGATVHAAMGASTGDDLEDAAAVGKLADTAAAAIKAVELKRGDCFVELDEQLELAKYLRRLEAEAQAEAKAKASLAVAAPSALKWTALGFAPADADVYTTPTLKPADDPPLTPTSKSASKRSFQPFQLPTATRKLSAGRSGARTSSGGRPGSVGRQQQERL